VTYEIFGVRLVDASVSPDATFDEAAATLTAHPVSTLAVVDEDGAVVGIFGGDDLIQGLFPAYLGELRHTAFAREDPALEANVRTHDPIREHVRRAESIELDASALHAAERFLHCDVDALPVVQRGRFVGMLGRSEFCRAMVTQAQSPRDADRSGPEDAPS
jgi:CBS domain-containing protein